jgi:hypothetical protein
MDIVDVIEERLTRVQQLPHGRAYVDMVQVGWRHLRAWPRIIRLQRRFRPNMKASIGLHGLTMEER